MTTRTEDVFEKLGLFYLGSPIGSDQPLLYDSRDLLTHAICVGMTGSGKTGLGIGLLEEAAMDDVPAIIIDPKGDMGNLLLTFPELSADDLVPWVDVEAARRKGLSVEEFADKQATTWREGLAEWGQTPDRIARLRDKVDMRVFTPGSTAGTPVSIVDSFAAPSQSIVDDPESFADRVEATATSILALVGVSGDPLQLPEHVFLSNLLSHLWKSGVDLDLASLIRAIQRPPIDTIGVMPLDDVFGPKARTGLAMKVNSLVASPGFSAWLQGQPLDIDSILWTPEGKPRLAIFNIAHLGEAERMFFVSLLLQRVVGWVRRQPGTSSLRALVYMDEIFGYVPPVAQPPSKRPIMTLLKQARAHGLGVILATQNPADIDYKAISNAGTWFLGRLQTERDVDRLLDGLRAASESGSGDFDANEVRTMLGALDSRQFLLHNVHDDGPTVFRTRWVMSYLRGPMTRSDIERLEQQRLDPADGSVAAMDVEPARPTATPTGTSPTSANASATRPAEPATSAASTSANRRLRPAPIDGVDEAFMPITRPAPDGSTLLFRPMVYGYARVTFDEPRRNFEERREVGLIAGLSDGPIACDWTSSFRIDQSPSTFSDEPPANGNYVAPPKEAVSKDAFKDLRDRFEDHLYREERWEVPACPSLDLEARSGESIQAFTARRDDTLRQRRDDAVDAARSKWERKLKSSEDRVFRAEQKVAREEDDIEQVQRDAVMDVGGALLSSFFGRRRSTVSRVGRGMKRNMKEKRDVERAEQNLAREVQKHGDLQDEMRRDLEAIANEFNPASHPIGTTEVNPDRDDVDVIFFVLAWVPYFELSSGERVRGC